MHLRHEIGGPPNLDGGMSMNAENTYPVVAEAYANGVRALFAVDHPPAGGQARAMAAPFTSLAGQAEALLPLSQELTRVTANQFDDADPALRAEAASRLLAKALTDLQVGSYLLQAAQDEEGEMPRASEAVPGPDALAQVETNMELLLSEAGAARRALSLGAQMPADLPSARAELTQAVDDTLESVRQQATQTAQTALGALLGLGISQVAAAAGVVGVNIAEALGQADRVTRLYNLFRAFVLHAYNSLVALLGPTLAQTAAKQVLLWVNDLVQGKRPGHRPKRRGSAKVRQRARGGECAERTLPETDGPDSETATGL
jgi:hypothetical protein